MGRPFLLIDTGFRLGKDRRMIDPAILVDLKITPS